MAVTTISVHVSAVTPSRLGKLRILTEMRANTRRAAKVLLLSFFFSVSSVRMTDGEVAVRSFCQIQRGWAVLLMLLLALRCGGVVGVVGVAVVVIVVVGVNAHLRLVFASLISLRSGRVVIRIDDALSLPKLMVQICSLVAAAVTAIPGRKKMRRGWRGAREMVKRTSPVRALVTRSSHKWRRRAGGAVPWLDEAFADAVSWEVGVMDLAAARRAWILSSRGGIELLVDMMSLSLSLRWNGWSNARIQTDLKSHFVSSPLQTGLVDFGQLSALSYW